ncbi:MAG: TolB family protein [Longimicrobiaceae bacterium]
MSASDLLRRLKQRKIAQWALAYLAGGWALLQVLDVVANRFDWPNVVMRVVMVAFAAGLLATLVLAWYHGERGHQRATTIELLMLAGVLMIGGAAVAFVGPAPRKDASAGGRTIRVTLSIPPDQRLIGGGGSNVVFSPDGRALVYDAVTGEGGQPMLYYRQLDDLTARPLPGTAGAWGPFFSPDGQWVGFFERETLKKVPVGSGAAVAVAQVPGAAGGAWGAGDVIIVGSARGLLRLPASGGSAQLVTRVVAGREITHAMPRFLPDGKTVAFDVDYAAGGAEASRIGIVSLASGKSVVLDVQGRNPVGLVDGYLIVGRPQGGAGLLAAVAAGALVAVPFDTRRWRATGPEVPLMGDVAFKSGGGADASLADDGSLVYVRGIAEKRLVFLDAGGVASSDSARPAAYRFPRFSPDGRRIAVQVDANGSEATNNLSDIWTCDLASGALSRMTSRASAGFPAWTPDGRHITYVTAPSSSDWTELWRVPFDDSGPEERMYALPAGFAFRSVAAFTPDGSAAVAAVRPARTRLHELWLLKRSPTGAWQGTPLLRSDFNLDHPALSPDGRWLAYMSDETGTSEVYVRPFPGPGGRVQVSSGGGAQPRWSPDGRRLYYRPPGGFARRLRMGSLTFAPSLGVSARGEAFPGATSPPEFGIDGFDVRPDGRGFVALRSASEHMREIVVVLNWREEVRRRLRAPPGSR